MLFTTDSTVSFRHRMNDNIIRKVKVLSQRDSWVYFKRLKPSVYTFKCAEESTGPTSTQISHAYMLAFALPHRQQILKKSEEKFWKQTVEFLEKN